MKMQDYNKGDVYPLPSMKKSMLYTRVYFTGKNVHKCVYTVSNHFLNCTYQLHLSIALIIYTYVGAGLGAICCY